MRSTATSFVIVFIGVVLVGGYWAIGHAQEAAPLFPPPPVLPSDVPPPPPEKALEKKMLSKYPYQAPPLPAKGKPDPSLIIPAEAYEVPRSMAPMAETRPVMAVQGTPEDGAPVGNLPPLPGVGGGNALPPPLFPPPPVAPVIEEKKFPMIEEKKIPEAPAALPGLEPVKPAVSLPPPPPEPTKALIPPPTVVPDVVKDVVVAPPVVPAQEQPKAFVRIHSSGSGLAAPTPPGPTLSAPTPNPPPLPDKNVIQQSMTIAPPPAVESAGAALTNLRTPSVTVEKRGVPTIQAGETQAYQIVIRNLGPGPAQQIRIDDTLPDSVAVRSADPMPQMQGNQASWVLPMLAANEERVLQISLQASALTTLASRLSVQVAALDQTTTTVQRPRPEVAALAMQLIAPSQIFVGKPAVFEIRVVNQSTQPLSGLILHGILPAGLNTPQGARIEGEVPGVLQPGEVKKLKMPTNAVMAGRYTLEAKVTTQGGQEASATTPVDITSESLVVQQAPSTRLFVGRDGDLRIEVANHTSRPLRNVSIADRLPEGLDYVISSARGQYQANSRTVYWLIDNLPAGATRALVVRVQGSKAGQYTNAVSAKADGVTEIQSSGALVLQAVSDLSMRVIEKDKQLEIGRETVYEIQVNNPGNAAANNVRIQVEFPPGLAPKSAQGDTRYSVDRQSIVFEPIRELGPREQTIYGVTAVAQTTGDQRVRFAVASEQVPVPVQREISTLVYRD